MKDTRNKKLVSLITHLAAEFVIRNSGTKSLITITDAKIEDDMKKSVIYFTVLPEEFENEVLDFLKRKRSEFRDFVKEKWEMRIMPMFDFEIDKGEKNRQRIDDLLSRAKN